MRRTPRFTAQSNWDATVFWRMGSRLRLWICITLIRKKSDLWLERARASLVASFANSARCHGSRSTRLMCSTAMMNAAYHYLDLVPLGRHEEGVGVPHGLAAAARPIYARVGHRRLLPDIIHNCARR